MATTIQIKRSTGTSAPSSLSAGELAVTFGTGTQSNLGDRLFIGDGSNVDVIGGKFFSDMLDHVQGTLTAGSAITVDGNKAVDDLIVGNNATTGGSIELKEGTNNGTHHVQLKAPNSLGGNLALTLPGSDGNSGEVLKTNGSGTLSFGTLALGDLTGTLALSALEIDGGTDIGEDLVDADLLIVDNGAGGTNRKSTLTRMKKYVYSAITGDATVANNGALTIANGSVENAMLAGSIANAKLSNSSITIGSDAVALGATQTDLNGITSLDVDNITVDGNTISTTNTNGNLNLDPNGTGTVDVSSARITSLATPTGGTDAANKNYVDAQLQGLDVKNSVRVATTANGTLSSAFANGQTVDGVTLATNDRILIKDQSTGSENGIYTVNASGAPTRATDFDADSEVTGGTFFFVEEGTVNADNGFVMTNDGSVTVGTTALVFTQFSGAGQVIAGAALTKSGNTLNVGVDDSSIEVNSDALRVKASGITNAMLAGSIDLTAKVTGALPVGNGGTGLSSIAKGSVLVANSANTLSALDGGGSNDGILTYTASSDTIAFATAVDGGTFS
tara:strand:+ start:1793 stop:3478 length:1686 start_codon:yes stop_codon:yes gene_type:complete